MKIIPSNIKKIVKICKTKKLKTNPWPIKKF